MCVRIVGCEVHNSKIIHIPAALLPLYSITFVPIAITIKIAHLLVHRGATFLSL